MSLSTTFLLQNQSENTDMCTLTEYYISLHCCTKQQNSIAGSRIVGVQLECSGTYIKNVLGHYMLYWNKINSYVKRMFWHKRLFQLLTLRKPEKHKTIYILMYNVLDLQYQTLLSLHIMYSTSNVLHK